MLNTNILVYSLLIGIFMSLHYTGFKMIQGSPNVALFYIYLILTIFNLCIILFTGDKLYSAEIQRGMLWFIITALCVGIFVLLTIKGFQSGFNIVSFPLMNTILSTIFLLFINYYYFKGTLNIYNFVGLFLGILSIYFLSLS